MNTPTFESRLADLARPVGRKALMYHKWRNLLFLHWEFDPEIVQKTLPPGLTLDTYNGKAFVGVVPFYMKGIRPRFVPALPFISDCLELNVRTYVFDKHGRPGVWFYSLDCDEWLAVRVARKLFHLPYFDAKMDAPKLQEQVGLTTPTDVIDFSVHRKGYEPETDTRIRYTPTQSLAPSAQESLEFFLIERHRLFSFDRPNGRLFTGRVSHPPYPLADADYHIETEGSLALAGFNKPERAPDHAIFSAGVDVEIFAIEEVV